MMKTLSLFARFVALLLLAVSANAQSNISYSYTVTIPNDGSFAPICNQLDHGSNTLNEILTNVPDGTMILKWDCTNQDWSPIAYTYSIFAHQWSPNGILPPGEGALIVGDGGGGNLTLTFTGQPHVPVLPATLPCGYGANTFLGRQTNGLGTYENITGLTPVNGAQLRRWNVPIQDFDVYTFNNGWSPSVPLLNVGEPAMLFVPTNAAPPLFTTLPPGGDLGCNPALPTDASVKAQVTVSGNCAVTVTNVTHFDTPSPLPCTSNRIFTITATNACGGSSATNVTYTWKKDITPPSIVCTPVVSISCTDTWTSLPPSVSDACCTNVTLTLQKSVTNGVGCPRFITNSWLATDCCSNTSVCTQTLAIVQLASQTVPLGGSTNLISPWRPNLATYQWFSNGVAIPTATNSSFNITNFNPGNAGIYNINVSAGLLFATFHFQLGLPNPCLIVIQCPTNIFMQSCTNVEVNYSATATDACFNTLAVDFIPPSGTSFPPGVHSVLCSATNAYGSATCVFMVTVQCGDGSCCSNSVWMPFLTTNRPSARQSYAMAYDSVNRKLVLFGGIDTHNNRLNDTWLWDGLSWTRVFPFTSPSPRFGHDMAWDAARNVVVLYGGFAGSAINGETWEWDGVNWTRRFPANSPGLRYLHSMAFDPVQNRIMLYGGSSGLIRGDTWEWTGNNWTLVAANGAGPLARVSTAMATDPSRQRVVLFGGTTNNTSSGCVGDTWEWTGSAWSQVFVGGPSPRQAHGLAFSPACAAVILFGGSDTQFSLLGDTWQWDGASWMQRAVGGPAPRQNLRLGTDVQNNAVALFGGFSGTNGTDTTWEWSCNCGNKLATDGDGNPILPAGTVTTNDFTVMLDTNGTPIFPPWADTSTLAFHNRKLGRLQDLYPEWDTTLDLWYTNRPPCPQNIGGFVPTNTPDFLAALASIGISNVTLQQFTQSIGNWKQSISNQAAAQPVSLGSAPAVGPPYYPPSRPHCVDPRTNYVFGGRDIVFVHGLKLDHLHDKFLNVPGALAKWTPVNQWPANTANPEFYNNSGYFKTIANCNWEGVPGGEGHISKFLTSKGYANRYITVAYSCNEPLEVAVQSMLTQISDAMHFGTGVVDLSGNNDTSNFGTPSFVIVSHSTGPLVVDVALSAAALHPNLNADYIPRFCKAHVAYDGIFSGSDMASLGVVVSGFISFPSESWACDLVNWGLDQLRDKFPCSPNSTSRADCSELYNIANTSILVDLEPLVTQYRWGPYEAQMPVRTITVVGGHPTALFELKYLFMPGFDDGVTTINSQVGNPNPRLLWPSGFTPGGDLPLVHAFDMGVFATGNGPEPGLDSPKRAIGYYADQVLEPFDPLPALALIAGGATPYISPSGMEQDVAYDYSGTPFSCLNRYTNHFSYIQSASDHFSGYNGNPAFGGFNGVYYKDTGKVPPERNYEESRVLTDGRVFEPYPMYYPDDDTPLLAQANLPSVEIWERGYEIGPWIIDLGWFGKIQFGPWWIWRRQYDLLEGWETKMGCDYIYESVLRSPTNTCPVCIPPPADAALWLPFDETSGTIAHNLAGGYSGILYNGTVQASAGNGPTHVNDYNAHGLGFDGLDDAVRVPSYAGVNVGTNDFTLDAWVLRDTNSGTVVRIIVDKRRTSDDIGYSLSVSYGNLILTLADAGGSDNYRDTGTIPADGRWHFAAVTVRRSDHQGIRFYVDGMPTGILDPTGHRGSLDTTTPFWVARSDVGGNAPWMGSIDEVELFRRALSATEIRSLLHARWAGKCKFNCSVPAATVLCGQTSVTNIARICNYSIGPQTFTYHFEECSSGSHLSFNPAGYTTVVVPAGTCTNLPVIITVNSGCCSFCYKLVAFAQESGDTLSSSGQVYNNVDVVPCGGWGGDPYQEYVNVSLDYPVSLPALRLNNATGVAQNYNYRIVVVDQTGAFDSSHVSLNGLAPGNYVSGSVLLNPGASTNILLTAQFVQPDPLGIYSVVLQVDPTGEGAWESVSSLQLQNVAAPSQNPPLDISVSGNSIVLSWNSDGACHVQSATQLGDGQMVWTDVPGVSPVTLPLAAARQFFRLACP